MNFNQITSPKAQLRLHYLLTNSLDQFWPLFTCI